MTAFEGVVANLQRRYRETQSQLQKERIETFMSMRPCSACGGARLRPEALAVTVGGTTSTTSRAAPCTRRSRTSASSS